MISTITNKDGYVAAFAEFVLTDKNGNLSENGEYFFIFECWIHPQERCKGLLKKMLLQELEKYYWVKYIYYERRKYNKIKCYEIRRFLNGR